MIASRRQLLVGVLAGLAGFSALARAARAGGPGAVRLGSQPASLPDVMFSEAMTRDRILAAQLAAAGMRLDEHPFAKGREMVGQLAARTLDVALFGDMPTIMATLETDLAVVGLVKQTFSSVVGHHLRSMADLKGLKIAFAPGSTAHYTLMQGLHAAGLGADDVTLVPMEISEMPKALAEGRVAAFAAWEPAPAIALERDAKAILVHRGLNASFMVMRRQLVNDHPKAARAIAAAFLRAVNWMRMSGANLNRVAGWAVEAGLRFNAAADSPVTARQIAEITRRELLEVPAAPSIPARLFADGQVLHREFEFLKDHRIVPADSSWDRVKGSFAPGLMAGIIADGRSAGIDEYDYG